MGKYLALGHGTRTSLRSVRTPLPRAKYFPVRPSHSVNKYIFLGVTLLILFNCNNSIGTSNLRVRSTFKCDNAPGTFKCKHTQCKTCLIISDIVNMSRPNRSDKVTDHFTCISVNVIYCITCTLCKKIYIGQTGRRFMDTYEMWKKMTHMRPNQLHSILIFLITPSTT